MKKILSIIGIIFLVSLMFVPLVSAIYVCPAAFTTSSATANPLTYVHPSSSVSYVSAVGSAFTANSTAYLYNVTVMMSKSGSPTGNLTANLYYVSGTPGTSAVPMGSPLETSQPINSASLTTSKAAYTFNFSGTTQIAASTDYAIVIQVESATVNVSNDPIVFSSTSDTDAAKNNVRYFTSGWQAHTTRDMYFVINGDTVSGGGTPYGTPTPTPAPDDAGDAEMDALVNAILPWLVPLLICLIPALLGYKFVGELGFFIGLNVGCILAYVTLAATAYAFPLWGIILVGVMDVAVVLMRR